MLGLLVLAQAGCRRSTDAEHERAAASTSASSQPASGTKLAEIAELPGLRALELPEPAGGSSPALFAGADELHLAWMRAGAEPSVMLASLPLSASAMQPAWTSPQRVATGPRLFSNWADVPAVAETPGGRRVVAWPELHGDDPAGGYAPRVAAELDDGSFGPPWSPDDVRRGPESGFVGFAATGTALHMFWLDGRELSGHGHGDHGGDHGTMQLRTVELDEDGQPLGPSKVVDERTCECCKLGVSALGDQPLAAYRDRSADEVRDIYVGGPALAPTRVAADGWTIAGCPVNGPALASAGARLHVAWFTGADDRSSMRLASTDNPDHWGPAIDFDLGLPGGRVDLLALPDGGALVSWVELDADEPGHAKLLTRRIDPDGKLGQPWAVAAFGAARDWGFPRTAKLGDDIVWVFTDPREAKLQALLAPVPS